MKKIKERNDLLISNDIKNSNVFRRITWHLSKPTVYKPAVLMIVFFVLQQFTGIYTFQFNAVKMLQVIRYSLLKYSQITNIYFILKGSC